jgi:hypothetical protein
MKSKNVLCGLSIAVVLQFAVLAGSAQTNKWFKDQNNLTRKHKEYHAFYHIVT